MLGTMRVVRTNTRGPCRSQRPYAFALWLFRVLLSIRQRPWRQLSSGGYLPVPSTEGMHAGYEMQCALSYESLLAISDLQRVGRNVMLKLRSDSFS